MKKDQPSKAVGTEANQATDNKAAQRHHKQSQVAQLSQANVEESPRMDRGSDGGAGESLERTPDSGADESLRRDDTDEQYGTHSSMKAGRASSGGSGSSGGVSTGTGVDDAKAPNPGSSEKSAGAERDTMTTARPGSRRR